MSATRTFIAAVATFWLFATTAAFADDWRLRELSGSVRVAVPARAVTDGTVGQTLPIGTSVTTGQGSRAVITNGDQRIVVGPSSRTTLAPEQGGVTRILQDLGSALFQVDRRTRPHFRVETPLLAAVVKGTTFTVSVDAAGDRVHVAEGLVEVRSNSGNAAGDVVAGATAVVTRDQPGSVDVSVPSASVPLESAAVAVAPIDYSEASGGLVQNPVGLVAVASAANSATPSVNAGGGASAGPLFAAPNVSGVLALADVNRNDGAPPSTPAGGGGATAGNGGEAGNGNGGTANPGNGNAGANPGNGNNGGGNSGNGNAGANPGNGNNGGGNSGNGNNGGGSSENGNSGGNAGNGNSSGGNPGNENSGGSNSGNGNSGANPGIGNAGNGNSGNGNNSGGNSANGNSGSNSGNGNGNAGGNNASSGNGNAGEDGAAGPGNGNAGGNSGNGNGNVGGEAPVTPPLPGNGNTGGNESSNSGNGNAGGNVGNGNGTAGGTPPPPSNPNSGNDSGANAGNGGSNAGNGNGNAGGGQGNGNGNAPQSSVVI